MEPEPESLGLESDGEEHVSICIIRLAFNLLQLRFFHYSEAFLSLGSVDLYLTALIINLGILELSCRFHT